MRRAVFPGSFDPITKGHENIVRRALPLFDEVVIGIGHNSGKQSMFSLEQRLSWLNAVFADEPKIRTATYEGLTADFCERVEAHWLIRGVRNGVVLTVESYWSLYSTDDEWQLSGFCADFEGNPMESWGSFETPEKAALEVLDRFRTIHAIWEKARG